MLDIDLPVIQAPMAGVQGADLAIAVSGAGGLGSLPCAMLDAAQLRAALERIAAATPRPVNLNFFCHAMPTPDASREARWREALQPYYDELGLAFPDANDAGARRPIDAAVVDVIAGFRPKVVSFHFGLPAPDLLQRIKGWGAFVLGSATTIEEGRWLAAHGADAVIAQGLEAGGHRGHFLSDDLSLQLPLRDLLAGLAHAIDVPLIAAGGIGSHADVRAALRAGASAVQVGTSYLLCPEATTSPVHRTAIARASVPDTALTNLFSGRPARGISNRLMRDLGPLSDLPPAFPLAAEAIAPLRSHAERIGRDDFSPLWSGTNTAGCSTQGAAEITRTLAGA
ncbi:2-nitropropane dioxygenase [Lysobacter helvus]|uniref:Propionate 3-nitronate monooxygenase n=2 Tax=Lysobacteraceae TaxID=32033 RepID=A0ABM7Q928_9GAMM|nr:MULTISPECIES: nitronate monooxygenase [Lysobacter]BCT93912.1 2-nitropropane dioxygenase [Lysobacter caseinilyticus]BCT97068.1 2-nitropropane dioxygenase [Lysobacter helvus]